MTLRSKIYIDRIFGTPVILFLNYLCLLFREKNIPRNVHIKNILVCKFMGMGSIIQSTPLMTTLKNNYPCSNITFLTIRKNYELLTTFPFVDQILTIDESSVSKFIFTTIHVSYYLAVNRIDVFIDLEIYSFFSKLFVPLSRAKLRFGYYKTGSKKLTGIYSGMLPFNNNIPVKNLYLNIAEKLECKNLNKDLYDYKNINHSSNFGLIQGIIPGLYNNDYIVINPNASELRIERRWPAEYYCRLLNEILDIYPGVKIVLTGSADEKMYVTGIADAVLEKYRSRIVNSSGQLNLSGLISLINQSRLMITNDSGPMHIAFALNKTTIALFGPCSPLSYENKKNVEFVYKKIFCSPCVHDHLIPPCKGDNQCMKLISVFEVIRKVKAIMENDLLALPTVG
ncbi:MAG: glycosyltransferase family 9 protein [Ignavibacteriaceae bacterium]|nr:glycosyltransferase family 9 protein [Ignavibacteriaceae bacterium]